MKIILSLLLFFSLSANGQTLNTTTDKSQWKKYEDTSFTIEYPSNWIEKLPDAATPFLYFISPRQSTEDTFTENVNISHHPIIGLNLTMDTIVSATIFQVKNLVTNGHIIESKRLEGKGGHYHKLVYKGDMGKFSLQFEQYYVLAGDRVYVLTFTSEQHQFDQYQQMAERILNSFELKQ